MAWTVTLRHQLVMGNQRVVIAKVDADSAEANLSFPWFTQIHSVGLGISSMDSGPHSLRAGENSSGTADLDVVGASGFASGDTFYVVAYGK